VAYVAQAAKEIAAHWPPKDAFVYLNALRDAERQVSEDVVRLFDTGFSDKHKTHLQKVADARLASVAAAFASKPKGGRKSPTATRGNASEPVQAASAGRYAGGLLLGSILLCNACVVPVTWGYAVQHLQIQH
jgi:hypothetical protein